MLGSETGPKDLRPVCIWAVLIYLGINYLKDGFVISSTIAKNLECILAK
jgi:hypothetical protein